MTGCRSVHSHQRRVDGRITLRTDVIPSAKGTLWFLFVLFIPLIGVLVYLIARGGSMSERAAGRAQR
jgi:hypothetical protein